MEFGGSRKTLKSYLLGFGLSILLTVFAFGLVMQHLVSDVHLYIVLTVLALTQLFVQSVCFLGLNNSSEGRWNLLTFLYAILIMTILVGGTLWIMYNLNVNMM